MAKRQSKQPNDFDKLKAKWYSKLEKSGFNNIELDENRLRAYSSDFARKDPARNSVDTWQTKAEYYQIAEHFLNTHKFTSNLDRMIWEYHVNGISARDITKLLVKVRIKTSKSATWLIIDRLTKIMRRLYINE